MDTAFSTRDPVRNKVLKSPLVANLTAPIHLFVPMIGDCINTFIQAMLDRNERTVNFGQRAQNWAFDVTSHIIFGSPYGFMRKGGDTGGLLGALNLGLRYCAIIGQVPELHPWLIGNNTVMSILSKFQRFPNPTAIILQEAEIRLDSHSQEYHICGNSLLCKLATNHRLTKYGSRNTDSINLLFEIL